MLRCSHMLLNPPPPPHTHTTLFPQLFIRFSQEAFELKCGDVRIDPASNWQVKLEKGKIDITVSLRFMAQG